MTSRKREARDCVVALPIAEDADAGPRASEHPAPEQTRPRAPQARALAPDRQKRLVDALADVVLADLLRYPPLP